MTYQPEDLFTGILVFNENTSVAAVPIAAALEMIDVEKIFNTIDLCYAFRSKNKSSRWDNFKLNRAFLVSGLIYAIYFNLEHVDYISKIEVSFLSSKEKINAGFMKSIHTSIQYSIVAMTFMQYESLLLPKPYKTECNDYADFNGSRALCYDVCTYNLSIHYFNRIYPGIRVDETRGEKVIAYNGKDQIPEIDQMKLIESECHQKCLHERPCHQIIYVPEIQSTVSSEYSSALFIFTYTVPPTSIVSIPRLGFWEFITDIASTFGFWLGVSMLGFIKLVNSPHTTTSTTNGVKRSKVDSKRRKKVKRSKKKKPFDSTVTINGFLDDYNPLKTHPMSRSYQDHLNNILNNHNQGARQRY